MKGIIVFLLIVISGNSFGQDKYVLLHRAYQKPAIFTDSITKDNISKGYYPIYSNQLDSFLFIVGQFKHLFKQGGERKYFNNEDYKTSSITLEISNSHHTYADRYDIDVTSRTEHGTYKLKLADLAETTGFVDRYIKEFYNYIRQTIKERDKNNKKDDKP